MILIAVAVVLCDQLSKAWITDLLRDGRSLQAVPGLLDLHLVHNTGAAFSLLREATPVLGLLSLLVVIAVLIWLWRQQKAADLAGDGCRLAAGRKSREWTRPLAAGLCGRFSGPCTDRLSDLQSGRRRHQSRRNLLRR